MSDDMERVEICRQILAEVEADAVYLKRKSYPRANLDAALQELSQVYDNLNTLGPEDLAGCMAKYRVIGTKACMTCSAPNCPLKPEINEDLNVPDQRLPDDTLVPNGR